MRFLALDLEATGLNPNEHQILQISAIAFDLDGNEAEFNTFVRWAQYVGQEKALAMNVNTIKKCDAEGYGITSALLSFSEFLQRQLTKTRNRLLFPVGFNVSAFDVAFLKVAESKAPDDIKISKRISHRGIELGTLYLNPKTGEPATSHLLSRQFFGRDPTHDALQDCKDAKVLFLQRLKK